MQFVHDFMSFRADGIIRSRFHAMVELVKRYEKAKVEKDDHD